MRCSMDNKNFKVKELDSIGCIARILTYVILFGLPFGIGILVGHFCW